MEIKLSRSKSSQSKYRSRVICYTGAEGGFLKYLSETLISFAFRNIFKQQGTTIRDNRRINKLYKDLARAERLSKTRINDHKNLARIHEHFDRMYPTTGAGGNEAHRANEAVRMFKKAILRLEGSGSVLVPNGDPLNKNYRLKIAYFLEHRARDDPDLSGKGSTELRLNHPKNLDCSKLVKYEHGKLVGIKDYAPSDIFNKHLLVSTRFGPAWVGDAHAPRLVKLTPNEKFFVAMRTVEKHPRDLINLFSYRQHHVTWDSEKLPHPGKTWDGLLNYNDHKTVRETSKLLQAAIAKGHEVMSTYPSSEKTSLLELFLHRFDDGRPESVKRERVTAFLNFDGKGFDKTLSRPLTKATARAIKRAKDMPNPRTHSRQKHSDMLTFNSNHDQDGSIVGKPKESA